MVLTIREEILVVAVVSLTFLVPHNTIANYPTATPIQHIIIIMQENHSFDNYFGTYPTANGTLVDSVTSQLQSVNGIPNQVCLSYENSCISPELSVSSTPLNPVEGQRVYEMDYSNNGTGFPSNSGPQSMNFFDYHSVAAYWDYAEGFGLADNYFAAVLGTTTPNRLMMLSGDTPVSANYGPPPYIPYSATVMKQLDDRGVSWGYFDYLGPSGSSRLYPLNYSSGMPLGRFSDIGSMSNLYDDLTTGEGLPSVSFVNSLGNSGLTEHPPFNPTLGELWAVSTIDQVMESSYWSSTAIFVTWDEGGGYYDHVLPPSEITIDHNFTQPLIGFGQRVPLLVISPFSKQNFVSHELLSHLSLLHFIDYNWNILPTDTLVSQSSLPLAFFNFTEQPRTPIILDSSSTYPLPLGVQSTNRQPVTVLAPELILSVLFVLAVVVVRLHTLPAKNQIHRKQNENGRDSQG